MSDVLVVKLGGTTFDEQRDVLAEIAEIGRQRPVVVVHGGGRRLTEWLARLACVAWAPLAGRLVERV